jgi:hypothetical protein
MISTFEQSVYISFLVCIIHLCYILNVICSFRYRIKFVLENAEDFCPWNRIKSSEVCKALIFFRECTTCQKKMPSLKLQAAVFISLKWYSAYKVTDRLVTYQPEVTAHMTFL